MKSKINLTKACKRKHTYEQMIVTALYARSKMWGSYVHVPFSIAWVEGNTWLSCYGFLGSSFSFMHIYISRLRLQRKQGSFLVSHFTIRRRVATKNERVASNRPDKMVHQSINEAVLEDNPLCNNLIRFCVWLNSFNVEAVDWSIITSHVLLA